MIPTAEQTAVRDAFRTGKSLTIEAGAGTGKTSTLVLLAMDTSRRGQYLAFNRAIVADSAARFPSSVAARTMHSLAFGAVGKQYKTRLDGGRRMRSEDIARALRIDPIEVSTGAGSDKRRLAPGWLAGRVMEAVGRFCQSADETPGVQHFAYVDGLDMPQADGRRGYSVNREVNRYLAPHLTRAWMDLCQLRGTLRFEHCQPPGTLVRRLTSRMPCAWEDVPIEQIREGDYVVTWDGRTRRGMVRRQGRPVTAAGQRDFAGELVTITTDRGRRSSYTPDHICIARLDADLSDGNHVVYLAQRGDDYRIGRTTWRTRSQSNSLGIRRRADSQEADGIWVLSVHATDREAALAEALTAHEFHLPTWQFRAPNEVMPCAEFWAKAGNNREQAAACLRAHGRDIRFPLFEGDRRRWTTLRPATLRACNLLPGMLVCEPDEMTPQYVGELRTYHGSGAWAPITVARSPYVGPVFSLDVAGDHTYVADGIVTHNCHYLKLWQLGDPIIPADFIMFDESQDVSPVMRSIVERQQAQQVWVGDSAQEIYSWTGAQNALAQITTDQTCYLTQSFRFGPEIADVANAVLGKLDTPLRLRGLESIDSDVVLEGDGPEPDCILTRTNACSVRHVLSQRQAGRSVHLVGGGTEVLSFARAAEELQLGGHTSHRELSCFQDWAAVQAYTIQDALGGELRLLVQLVDEFGVRQIERALAHMPKEADAEVVVSTTHKYKGREARRVKLADDFPSPGDTGLDPAELRLLYVAATRAKNVLDLSACPTLAAIVKGEPSA
jgi:hypothetical protein